MAAETFSSTRAWTLAGTVLASDCSPAMRLSMAARRALASVLSASTRALTTVFAWLRRVLGSSSVTLFCTSATFAVTSACTSVSFFCAPVT
ncbi:hypothetical protein DDE18_02440 [Nocardioides gansuensis]|uniref:Uncharacterized protein n=1 Tax=Nocardioides gansuensis TaxID=2138300 RepID=A0A2T8FFJ9_9ACTN|nr:hypothetical protein DDE18_02440 [Nocardioides gansuensis]